VGRILLYLLAAGWYLAGLTGQAYAAPPAWYGDDIQRELPTFDETSDPSDGIGAAGESKPAEAEGQDPSGPGDAAPDDDAAPYDDAAPDGDAAPDDDVAPYDDAAPHDDSAHDEDVDGELDDLVPRQGIEGPRPPIVDVDPPSWWKDFEDWLKSLDRPDLDVMPILKTLGIGLLIVLCLIILATAFRRFRRFSLPTSPEAPRNALDDLRQITASVPHHEHAVEARWEVAIHALLLDALTQLSPRFAIVESPHITCREIAAHIETTHGPLTELVGISESCVFALIVATEDQYLRAIALHGQIIMGEK
jgi:hypothetical protein